MSDKIKLCVIGCGNMATELAKKAVATGRAVISVIHDNNPEVLTAKSTEFGAMPITDIARLADHDQIDAFVIGSPGYRHHENLMAVVTSGKPIYSEKPLCTTPSLCDEMIEACEKSGSKLYVGQVLRLFPLFWKSREILVSGEIGDAKMVSITRAGRGTHYFHGWRSSFQESGGPLLETNAHELDYLHFILGPAKSVYAQGLNLNGPGDYQDSFFTQVNFVNGGMGFIHSSNASPVGENPKGDSSTRLPA